MPVQRGNNHQRIARRQHNTNTDCYSSTITCSAVASSTGGFATSSLVFCFLRVCYRHTWAVGAGWGWVGEGADLPCQSLYVTGNACRSCMLPSPPLAKPRTSSASLMVALPIATSAASAGSGPSSCCACKRVGGGGGGITSKPSVALHHWACRPCMLPWPQLANWRAPHLLCLAAGGAAARRWRHLSRLVLLWHLVLLCLRKGRERREGAR